MQTTSSPTSPRPSTELRRAGLIAWFVLAAIFVAGGFIGQSSSDSDPDLFYDYGLAVSSVIFYGILIALTWWAATAYGDPAAALGVRQFPVRWAGIAIGLIFLVFGLGYLLEPVLHAGEEQGYAPDVWRPERAGAFFANGIVAATLVPFAEELFYRGLGTRALAFLGSAVAIGTTAVVFGLAHGVLVALPILVPFGIALAWVRIRSDSVWPGVVAHGFFNGLTVVALYADLTR